MHRFKSALRTKLRIWNDEKFLVGVSGGANSMALVDMMHSSMDSNTHRKMFYKVLAIHIDEGLLYKRSPADREAFTHKLKQFVSENCHFELCVLPLEAALSPSLALSALKPFLP